MCLVEVVWSTVLGRSIDFNLSLASVGWSRSTSYIQTHNTEVYKEREGGVKEARREGDG